MNRKVRVLKGGWWWLGIERQAGDVLAPPLQSTADAWIRDGLCEACDADVPAAVLESNEEEAADAPEAERATARPRKRK